MRSADVSGRQGFTVSPGVRRAAASCFPNSPQGRTISTAAITRNTRMMDIFGKIRMPNAFSSDTSTAATKAPMMLPRPPITTTTNTSTMIRKSSAWCTASRGICKPPQPAAGGDHQRHSDDAPAESDWTGKSLGQRKSDICAEHIERGVGKINDGRHTENDRQSRRNQKHRRCAGKTGQELDEVKGHFRS